MRAIEGIKQYSANGKHEYNNAYALKDQFRMKEGFTHLTKLKICPYYKASTNDKSFEVMVYSIGW